MYLTIWKISGESGKFPESLESFWTVLRVSSSVKSFQTVLNISRQSGKFPDILENFWTVLKVSGQSKVSWHVSHCTHGVYALLAHLCSKSYLRNFCVFLSRKQKKVFARAILETGKFIVFVSMLSLCTTILHAFTTWRPYMPWWDKQAGNASLFQMQLLGCC